MHPEYPDGEEVQGVYVCSLKRQFKQWVWFQGTVKYRLATPGNHGDLQLKIAWKALLEWGEKATTSNSHLSDDRPFPESPLQLRTPENQVAPGTVWTGNIPESWLEQPNIPEEQRLATPLAHKPTPGTMTSDPSDARGENHCQNTRQQGTPNLTPVLT